MKSAKYNYNKANSIVETIPQQSKLYKNTIPTANRQIITKEDNTLIANMDTTNYIRGNGVGNKNIGPFYQSQQIIAGVPSISTHNSSRLRFTPYPHYKRSYAHTLMQPINIRYYNYQSQLLQQTTSSNNLNMMDQSSLSISHTDSTYR